MSLNSIVAATPPDGWLPVLSTLASFCQSSLSRNDADDLVDRFERAIRSQNETEALNLACIGFVADSTRFVNAVRRRGLFRPSKAEFRSGVAARVVNLLLESNAPAIIDTANIQYLRSVRILYSVAGEVLAMEQRIIRELQTGREATIKGLIALVDLLFMKAEWNGLFRGGHARDSLTYDFFTYEQYAEALSYTLFLYRTHVGEPSCSPAIDVQKALLGHHLDLLRDAAHIRFFFELETLVDIFDYRLEEVSSLANLTLLPPTPELERAIRLGFIQTYQQTVANGIRTSHPDIASVRLLGQKLHEVAAADCIRLQRDPDRFVCGFPDVPNVFDPVKEESLFLEEFVTLAGAERSLMASAGALLALEVAPGITLRTILRTQRIINYHRWYFAHHLMPLLVADRRNAGVVMQSLIPCMPRATLIELVSIVVPESEACAVIDLLTWSPDADRVFDIQYQPLVKVGDHFWIPRNVVGDSNLIRNALQLTRRRLYEDGRNDPVPIMLRDVLLQHTATAASERKYLYAGKQGEIDVAALLGDILFVFECKNSLLPSGAHELRTSWDYVLKGASQLAFVSDHFNEPPFQDVLSQALGFSVSSVRHVITCIVMPNRMFMGWRCAGHAVRGLFDLIHFIQEGTLAMGEDSKCFWSGSSFQPDDLVNYLDGDITYVPAWESMTSYEDVIHFGATTIRRPTVFLDLKRMAQALGFDRVLARIEALEAQDAAVSQHTPA